MTTDQASMIACPRCTPPTDPCCPYCDGTGGVPAVSVAPDALVPKHVPPCCGPDGGCTCGLEGGEA